MSRKSAITLGVGCLVSAAFIWGTTRGISWRDFLAALRGYRWFWLIPALAAFYYSMYLRAVRWGLLFLPHHRFSGRRMFPPMMICFAFNSIFPARAGEFVRCFYVGRREGTGVATAMATVAAERIFDGVCLLAMLGLALALTPPLAPDFTYAWGGMVLDRTQIEAGVGKIIVVSAALSVGVMVFMVPRVQLMVIRWLRRSKVLPGAWRTPLAHGVAQVAQGFHALVRPRAVAAIVFYTIAVWGLVAVSNIAVAKGFGIEMGLVRAMGMVTLVALFILIPAAPGYWGLFEAGGVFALVVLGVLEPGQEALAFAATLMMHLVQYVPVVAVGLFFAWRGHVRPRQALNGNAHGDCKP